MGAQTSTFEVMAQPQRLFNVVYHCHGKGDLKLSPNLRVRRRKRENRNDFLLTRLLISPKLVQLLHGPLLYFCKIRKIDDDLPSSNLQ